jgi:hypothetical protein
MAKSKKQPPRQISPEELLSFHTSVKESKPVHAPERAKKLDETAEKEQKVFEEIGCRKVRIWSKTVEITGWNKKNESVFVKVNGEPSSYNWPFHPTIAFPFINFEVLEDFGYLDRFANCEEYNVNGRRYAVKDDVVWAGGIRYISSHEKVKFGSFKTFLSKQQGFTVKKAII